MGSFISQAMYAQMEAKLQLKGDIPEVLRYRGGINSVASYAWQIGANATLYAWPKQFCRFLKEASRSYPEMPLRPEDIPGANGFWWFEEPIDIGPKGDQNLVRAVSFCVVKKDAEGPIVRLMDVSKSDGIGMTFYMQAPEAHTSLGFPMTFMTWMIGKTPTMVVNENKLLSIDRSTPERRQHKLRLLGAGLNFISTRILSSTPSQIDRAERRRFSRAFKQEPPSVRVIHLRHKDSPHGPMSNSSIDWQYRWMVHGHWRKQFYPSGNFYKAKWISPYVKGPEDKPLQIPADRIFAVVR